MARIDDCCFISPFVQFHLISCIRLKTRTGSARRARFAMAANRALSIFYKVPKSSYLDQGRWRGRCRGSDNHCRCHACSQRYRRWHGVDFDSNGNSLGEPHPRIDGLDRGQALGTDGRIWRADSARYAFDMPRQFLFKSHQINFGRVADSKAPEFSLLEIASDPIRIRINDGNIWRSLVCVISNPEQKVGYEAVYGRVHLGTLHVQLCLLKVGKRCLISSLGNRVVSLIDLLLLDRRAQRRQFSASLIFILLDFEVSSLARDVRLGQVLRYLVIALVDHIEKVSFVDELIVLDQQLHDLARYLGCNIGNLYTDLTVAGPRCHHIMLP